MRTILLVAAAVFVFANAANADIFQWEYINPADPGQGKRQSTTLAANGAGVDAVPGVSFYGLDLTMAYLIGADLTGAYGYYADLTNADLSQAKLTNAYFYRATLTNADFTNAEVHGANFDPGVCEPFICPAFGTGITLTQLYSTASYMAHDLSGVNLAGNNLADGNFAGQNLTNANFAVATLTDADFTNAQVEGAGFFAGGTGLTTTQLYSTASYQAHNLTGIHLGGHLSGWNFAGQNLTNAAFHFAPLTDADFREANLTNTSFLGADLTDADLTGADVRGANFGRDLRFESINGFYTRGTGIALGQLYSTASFQAHDLTGIGLGINDLSGGNFAGQNLANANFAQCFGVYCDYARLTGADLTAADTRGAIGFEFSELSGAATTNLIWSDGHVDGIDLSAGGLLVVHDYDGNPNSFSQTDPIPITIDQHFAMAPGGTLRMVFEADAWDSTISFAPGIPVTLGGTLELTFANDVNPASQLGRTFDLFDWTGISPTGAFTVSSPYAWDLSSLYTTGDVTLTAIPEPTPLALLLFGMLLICASRRGHCFFSVVLVVGCVSSAHADLPMTGAYVPEFQAVDALLQNFMAGKPIPGGTITITLNDKVIYERGIGYSDAAKTVPMQETALMRLASLSKPVTASAIHQLAKDGQLNLNDKVFNIDGNGGLLDIAPYNGVLGDTRLRDITVQHLLEHRGGWNRDTAGDLAFRDIQIAGAMGVPSPPGILNTAKYIVSRPLQFTPGTDYNYSNIGYMFLGMIVETASGQSYESYVDEMVLAPAGIPTWEIDAGRTFAADQNPREPFYSDPSLTQNVYNPTGPNVPQPYGGWDHERFIALGGLIASSKAMATLAQDRIVFGPEIGKLRSDYTTYSEYWWYHGGSLPGTDTLVMGGEGVWGADWKDASYSILFDRRPTTAMSYSNDLALLLEPILEGIATWPAPLVYDGDFTNDQWLTADDITLFTHALALGSEAAFATAYPTARYGAGDFDGDGQVNASDAAGLIAALQHAGVPDAFVSLVPELPGDFNRDGTVDAADYLVWRKTFGLNINLPNETTSLGLVDHADYDVWSSNLGTSLASGSGASLSAKVPEPGAFLLVTAGLLGVACCYPVRRRPSPALHLIHAILPLVAFATSARADIFQWEYTNPADPSQGKQQSTTLAPDGAGVDAVPGANLPHRNLTMAYLVGADLTGANAVGTNLANADLSQANLTDANFNFANLTNATFNAASLINAVFTAVVCSPGDCGRAYATLTDADFTDADIRGANIPGITLAQLYATASYQAHDLTAIGIYGGVDLSGGNFSGQNLSNTRLPGVNLAGANLRHANLANAVFTNYECGLPGCYPIPAPLMDADLTATDARGSDLFILLPSPYSRWGGSQLVGEGAIAVNMIRPDGHVNGLDLDVGELLLVRDFDSAVIPITIDQHVAMAAGGTLRMVFEADAWDSTISFAPGIPVTLGGTLELAFAADVNLASQVGRTFDLFDWTGVTPTGAFTIGGPYRWDTSNLYTTGEVTLTAIPEPAAFALIALGIFGLVVGIHCWRLRLHSNHNRGESRAETQRRRVDVVRSSPRPQRLGLGLILIVLFGRPARAEVVLTLGPGGAASLVNSSPDTAISLTSYSITRRDMGVALSPSGWDSFQAQGNLFSETSATIDLLSEAAVSDGLLFLPGQSRSIGIPFILRSDADGNGIVDLTDFAIWKDHQGLPLEGPGFGDFDWNGVVDIDDFEFLLNEMGNSAVYTFTQTSAVPEPATIALVACSLGLGMRRRKRRRG